MDANPIAYLRNLPQTSSRLRSYADEADEVLASIERLRARLVEMTREAEVLTRPWTAEEIAAAKSEAGHR